MSAPQFSYNQTPMYVCNQIGVYNILVHSLDYSFVTSSITNPYFSESSTELRERHYVDRARRLWYTHMRIIAPEHCEQPAPAPAARKPNRLGNYSAVVLVLLYFDQEYAIHGRSQSLKSGRGLFQGRCQNFGSNGKDIQQK